jgi:hypothetical protein
VTFFAYLALFGWIPAVVVMFALLPGRTAAVTAIMGAWLLLPPYMIDIAGLPDYSRATAASLGMIFGTLFFGLNQILAFRPRWFDLPVLLWCLTSLPTSLSNGLGLYDGLSQCLGQTLTWGSPYFFGRIYFSDSGGLRALTIGIVVGGFAYAFPCVWEMRMSPQLLGRLYGISSWQGMRFGGYRPHVFFATGIECGMWMTAVALTAWWLWRCGVIERLGRFSFGKVVLPILLITSVFCRSTGALMLLTGGIFLLWISTRFKTTMFLWVLMLIPPAYVAVRVPNLWSGQQLISLIKEYVSPERAGSLEYRFQCEEVLVAKAIQQPLLGWGGFGRSAVFLEEREVPTDGLWIITLGTKGFIGLILLYLVMELPAILFLLRFPVKTWHYPQVAPATLIATLLGLYIIDCLANGFINIIYVTLGGALAGTMPALSQWRTNSEANQAGHQLQRNTVGTGSHAYAVASEQGDLVHSQHIVSRMTMIDEYRKMGRKLKSQERWAETHSAWQHALELLTELTLRHPGIPNLQRQWCDCGNDLAWLLINHPDSRGPVYALTLAIQVVENCSDSEVYWNTVGAAYLRNGDPGTAIAALNRATALAGEESPFNHVFLAMAYAQLGDHEHAQHWLTQAILLQQQDYPNHPELTGLCNEARAVIGTSPGATPAVI